MEVHTWRSENNLRRLSSSYTLFETGFLCCFKVPMPGQPVVELSRILVSSELWDTDTDNKDL